MEQREHLTLTLHSPEVPKIKGDRKYQRIISNIPGPSFSSLSSPYSLALAGSSALASPVEEA
uniref:Transmembrane protein 202 n=1 Tax=Callithrix jacchus TaxID=9483 RepID=A0A8I3VWL2_CALJA